MTRGSNPPPPAQWNIQGWMAAYHAAQRDPTSSPTIPQSIQESKRKEECDMDEVMTGGWRFEGIERPPLIRICTKCQGGETRTDIESWCEDCKEGKPLGHEPEGVRPSIVSKDLDFDGLNKSSA